MSNGFTAKELVSMGDLSKEKLKNAIEIWHKYGTSQNTIYIIGIISIIAFLFGKSENSNIVMIIGLLGFLRSFGKEKEKNGYIEGYADGYSEGVEETQKKFGVDVDLMREIYYESP